MVLVATEQETHEEARTKHAAEGAGHSRTSFLGGVRNPHR